MEQLPPLPQQLDKPTNKRAELIKQLIEFDAGIHLLVGGFLLFLIFLMFAWKFNLINYFAGKYTLDPTKISGPSVYYTPKALASSSSVEGVYINQQVVSIEKAFAAPPDKIQLTVTGQLKKEVFGYLPYWALPKLDEINTKLLTSISYFGLEFDGNGNVVTRDESGVNAGWQTWNDDKMERYLAKLKGKRIKTLVTVKCFNRDNIIKLATTPQSQENFINNVLYLISSRKLDGVNIDFEYIGEPDKKVIDGYSLLMGSLNKEMKRQQPKSILTISTFATAASTITLHDVAVLAGNSDALVIMGYDFSTPKSASAGSVAPMDGLGYSLNGAVNSYLEKVDPAKIILAVPYYGYDWPVSSAGQNAAVASEGEVRVYTYAEIIANSKKTKINWDDSAQTPWYSYLDSQTNQPRVVHFENTRSLGIKYDFINQKNLKGMGIWALGFDGRNNDLLQLINDKFAK